jgi:phage FluMu protein Com
METDLLYPSEYVFDETQEVVKKLQKAGYDAYLYCTEFCPRCRSVSENTKREAEMQFVIRFSDSENYHVARSNILQDYLCVLEFLLGNEVMSGSFGETVPLNERVDVLVKMLGLTNVEAQQKIRNR